MAGFSMFKKASVLLIAQMLLVTQAEVISDLADVVVTSQADEQVALERKAEDFWRRVLSAADAMKMTEHLELYDRTEKVIAGLPKENEYVRKSLAEVLQRLRRADQKALDQALASSGVAADKLSAPASGFSGFSTFFSGGQNFMSLALRRFVAGGEFPERLADHVQKRQADVLPLLRKSADSAGNVLTDTRLASKLAFDVLKYDIYNKGVPKTPQAAKDVANELVDAVAETRHHFTSFISQMATSIADDASGKRDSAATTAFRAQLRAAEEKAASGGVTDLVLNI